MKIQAYKLNKKVKKLQALNSKIVHETKVAKLTMVSSKGSLILNAKTWMIAVKN
jgi:hypothetical protein